MKEIFRNLLEIFFPTLCAACHRRLAEREQHICLHCLTNLPKTNYHLQRNNKLEQFFAGRISFRRVASFAYFVKGGSMQYIIHELKYKNNPDLALFLGRLCGDDLKDSAFLRDVDYIVPIPLHLKRQKERGYNQALEIAKGISEKTQIPIDNQSVIRIKNNPSQAKSESRYDRWSNVENIFAITNKDVFVGKHILLIDDVLTTGSTIESCAKVILESKDSRISIYTVASAD